MTLKQEIDFLKMITFNNVEDIITCATIQKYFSITQNNGIEHIFKGYYDRHGQFNGYHTEILFPDLYHPIPETMKCNKNIPYQMYLSDVKKVSTFFPLTMSCHDIITAILLAYEKSQQKTIINPRGTMHEYDCQIKEYDIHIRIIMDINFKILDAYPII